jgi:hypothetical protein
MKRLVLLITLASLGALPHGVAAAPRARECPRVAVSCPDILIPGAPATFTVSIDNAPADAKLAYNWVISAGTIGAGQGTSSITVDTTDIPYTQPLTATVDVSGLPETCPDSASCSTSIYRHIDYHKTDEYGNIRWSDEKARLDNLGIELQNDPAAVGYIVGYGGRRSLRSEAARRIERAKRYLTSVRGIPSEHLVTIDGGYREELTVELWARPKEVLPPEPTPTVDPTEVKFIKPPPKRRARRR